jgi:VIT1/CCC1 family predicted Fe2+/Mn2+ transporter
VTTALEPQEQRQELATARTRRGVAPDLARHVAEQISANPEDALRFHAQEELGVNAEDLPSPHEAARVSFASFAIGAIVPPVPYLLGVAFGAAFRKSPASTSTF